MCPHSMYILTSVTACFSPFVRVLMSFSKSPPCKWLLAPVGAACAALGPLGCRMGVPGRGVGQERDEDSTYVPAEPLMLIKVRAARKTKDNKTFEYVHGGHFLLLLLGFFRSHNGAGF
jgi:hypothetical protein